MASQYSSNAGWYSPGTGVMLPARIRTGIRFVGAEHAQRQRAEVVGEVAVDGLAGDEGPEHERPHDHLEGQLGIRRRRDLAPLDGQLDETQAVVVALREGALPHRLAQLRVALHLADERLHEAGRRTGEGGATFEHEGPDVARQRSGVDRL